MNIFALQLHKVIILNITPGVFNSNISAFTESNFKSRDSFDVKTVESKVTDEDSNNLFHSKRKSNTDNDANPTENECKPEQVRESGLNTQPTPKNDCDTLTAEATVVQQDTESKSDTQAHLEPEILTFHHHQVAI